MTAAAIPALCPRTAVGPLLPSLPAAAMAAQPAAAALPLLSPIMRQRVQFLGADGREPWIRLLAYDPAQAARLVDVARSARFEPHPVSGEIETDWDLADVSYRRADIETLQALVRLPELGLAVKLVFCAGDAEGGGPGWRIGEVCPVDDAALASFGGSPTVAAAEAAFQVGTDDARDGTKDAKDAKDASTDARDDTRDDTRDNSEDDDDYWAQYDATPATRTPARTPARTPGARTPAHKTHSLSTTRSAKEAAEEDAYFSQYDDVQPAMDGHDPDEAELVAQDPELADRAHEQGRLSLSLGMERGSAVQDDADADHERLAKLVHPRPSSFSSTSSAPSLSVAGLAGETGVAGETGETGETAGSGTGSAVLVSKLEASAGRREQHEFGVKQHVSRSIKSLYMLARSGGIDRDEFEQLVKTELDLLAMME